MIEFCIRKLLILLVFTIFVIAMENLARDLGKHAIDRGVVWFVLGTEVRIGDSPPLLPKPPLPTAVEQIKPALQKGISAVRKAVKSTAGSTAKKAKPKSPSPTQPTTPAH